MSKRWFTSDTHFGHENVLGYCKRPFVSIEDHDEALIERWNRTVGKHDIVYHMGDFGLTKTSTLKVIKDRLNGRITLIRGNHDRCGRTYYEMGFHNIYDFKCLKIGCTESLLCHYPYFVLQKDIESEEWIRRMFRPKDLGGWLIHGHTHAKEKQRKRMINVGVDAWDFYPVAEEEIIEMME